MRIVYFLRNILLIYFIYSPSLLAKEKWILDKDLSTIIFELPVLFLKNVEGKFNEIEGLIEIDINNNSNNKAIFSVNINSIDINYEKHKNLLLSNIFFDSKNFPIALIDTKGFIYHENKQKFKLDVELMIKQKSTSVPLYIEIIRLAEDIVQIKGEMNFSRKLFKIGTGKWSSTTILKDKVVINTNLFLIKE